MLPKQYSFNLRRERGFFDKAQKVFSRYFTLFYIPSESFGMTIVVPKKRVSLATKRNALKRKIAATAQVVIAEKNGSAASFFVCLVAKSAAMDANKGDLEKELTRAFSSMQKNDTTK